ncbi:MAG: hypothetical protein ABJB16_12225 [Saprospiraceae bacterium]
MTTQTNATGKINGSGRRLKTSISAILSFLILSNTMNAQTKKVPATLG